MRLSEDKIKAGILHPDHDVRDAAAMYFSRSACRDPSILPLVIQAIEKYGWEQAFIVPPVAEGLPLSDETLPWVVKQLDSEDVRKDRTAFGRGWQGALVWLLCDADPNLLARHKSEIDGIKGLRKDDRTLIEMRVDLLNMKAESCWRELELIHGWLDTRPLQDVLPKSDFAEALRYIRNHWKELNVYVRDGRIPIDNNLVEQLMKQVAMGRKAWLFVCSVAGGEQSARMMTLVSSARRHDLDVADLSQGRAGPVAGGLHRLPPAAAGRLEAKPSGSGPPVPRGRASRQGRAQAALSRPPPSGRPPPPLTASSPGSPRPRRPPDPIWDW